MTVRRTAAVVAATALAFGSFAASTQASSASARHHHHHVSTCRGGVLHSGVFRSVRVSGTCQVADGAKVLVLHNIVVKRGASFDASTHSKLKVLGNVYGARRSSVALGCTDAHPCSTDGQPGVAGADVIRGRVVLNHVYNAAINGVTIKKSLISHGGGAGPLDPETQFVPFSVKDDTIGRNIRVVGLNTVWFGVIRSNVGGSVILLRNKGTDPDANEVVANTIGKNLVCYGNSPAAQFGDAISDPGLPPGYGPNSVGGHARGQCKPLTHLPAS
jgi:hypothetical protein